MTHIRLVYSNISTVICIGKWQTPTECFVNTDGQGEGYRFLAKRDYFN